MSQQLVDHRGNPMQMAGRYFVSAPDGSFSAEQYADMILNRLFESAKDYPEPLKGRVLERKFEVRALLIHYVSEAQADARSQVGRLFESEKLYEAAAHLPLNTLA